MKKQDIKSDLNKQEGHFDSSSERRNFLKGVGVAAVTYGSTQSEGESQFQVR